MNAVFMPENPSPFIGAFSEKTVLIPCGLPPVKKSPSFIKRGQGRLYNAALKEQTAPSRSVNYTIGFTPGSSSRMLKKSVLDFFNHDLAGVNPSKSYKLLDFL
ncbi:MAG: hypothetical protein Q8P48_08760, partial [Deltaproteobacteria bacterium]|nr:hypothetical protein [Deltaproteobacteria bacterium]